MATVLKIRLLTEGLQEKIRKDGTKYYHGSAMTSESVVIDVYARQPVPALNTAGHYMLVNYRFTNKDSKQSVDILPETKVILRLLLHVVHFIMASYVGGTLATIMFGVCTFFSLLLQLLCKFLLIITSNLYCILNDDGDL